MKEDIRKYIAIVIVIIAVAIIFFLSGRHERHTAGKIEIRKISNPILPRSETAGRTIYNIDDVKKPSANESAVEINDLESMYKKYPGERAGENMIEGWSKVKAEDKAELAKGIAEAIKKSEEDLKANPDDQRAKSKLVISQMLQKLIVNNFNYKIKEQKAGHGR